MRDVSGAVVDVFVTGGSSFLGQHILRAVAASGHHVRALARSESAAATVLDCAATAVRGDLLDATALDAGMAGCDLVVHAAAYRRRCIGASVSTLNRAV
jgi:nucleoside-diphosphate-sugar epimerase